MYPINNPISRLQCKYDYNGIPVFLPEQQRLCFARPSLDIDFDLSIPISILLRTHKRVLFDGILFWCRFQFLCRRGIWTKKKRQRRLHSHGKSRRLRRVHGIFHSLKIVIRNRYSSFLLCTFDKAVYQSERAYIALVRKQPPFPIFLYQRCAVLSL